MTSNTLIKNSIINQPNISVTVNSMCRKMGNN